MMPFYAKWAGEWYTRSPIYVHSIAHMVSKACVCIVIVCANHMLWAFVTRTMPCRFDQLHLCGCSCAIHLHQGELPSQSWIISHLFLHQGTDWGEPLPRYFTFSFSIVEPDKVIQLQGWKLSGITMGIEVFLLHGPVFLILYSLGQYEVLSILSCRYCASKNTSHKDYTVLEVVSCDRKGPL